METVDTFGTRCAWGSRMHGPARRARSARCGCIASPARWSLKRALARQFRSPAGWAGRFAGIAMALKNRARLRWTLELLNARRGERLLEIGPGPGVAIRWLIDSVPGVLVDAAEPSAVMRDQASGRNRAAISEGRVRVFDATSAALPCADGTYDAILTSNVAMFWDSPHRDLAEIARVVKTGGRLVVTVQMRGARSLEEIGRWTARFIGAAERAGWHEVARDWRPMHPVGCVGIVLGRA